MYYYVCITNSQWHLTQNLVAKLLLAHFFKEAQAQIHCPMLSCLPVMLTKKKVADRWLEIELKHVTFFVVFGIKQGTQRISGTILFELETTKLY